MDLKSAPLPVVCIYGGASSVETSSTSPSPAVHFAKEFEALAVAPRLRIIKVSKDHALLMSDIIRYKADKSVLETGRYIYSIRRADPSWQITGVTNVDPAFTGPGDYPRTF